MYTHNPIIKFIKSYDLFDLRNVLLFVFTEVIVICIGGAIVMHNDRVEIPITDEELIESMEDVNLEMRSLEVPEETIKPIKKKPVLKEDPDPTPTFKRLRRVPVSNLVINRLINVESSNNDRAEGDKKNGVYRAKGCLQMWACYVKDVNRLYNTNYKHEDAFNRDKAIQMAQLLIGRRAYCYQQKGYEVNEELLVRLHRLPYSPFASSNDKYWKKYKEKNKV